MEMNKANCPPLLRAGRSSGPVRVPLILQDQIKMLRSPPAEREERSVLFFSRCLSSAQCVIKRGHLVIIQRRHLMTFSYLNTFLYWCYLDNCRVCYIAATCTVLYRHWQWNFFALWRQTSDQKCLKFWHLICWSSEKPAKAPFTKTKISILWTVQCTEIVFQQKEKMESSRSNPDVWPCYSVFMCHHTTTSQTLQITPDISHPPGDLKKV